MSQKNNKNLIEQVYKRVRWRESIIKVSKSNIDTIVKLLEKF